MDKDTLKAALDLIANVYGQIEDGEAYVTNITIEQPTQAILTRNSSYTTWAPSGPRKMIIEVDIP